jgi:hypothetical protein
MAIWEGNPPTVFVCVSVCGYKSLGRMILCDGADELKRCAPVLYC